MSEEQKISKAEGENVGKGKDRGQRAEGRCRRTEGRRRSG